MDDAARALSSHVEPVAPTVSSWGVIGPADEEQCQIRIVRRLRDGKRWVRLEGPCNLTFTRVNGELHEARVGLVSDGASIPRPAQSIVGHPFDEYLEAALVHDQGCKDRSKPASVVHRVFYEMMRAQGVAAWKARVMYAAVFARRPTWTVTDVKTPDSAPPA